jgi:hypothetical protein
MTGQPGPEHMVMAVRSRWDCQGSRVCPVLAGGVISQAPIRRRARVRAVISNEQRLDTSYGDLSIVIHMDGQGTPENKDQTWDAVTSAAPAGVFFGWKNFFVKDHPMMSPQQTMARTPQPVMISSQ